MSALRAAGLPVSSLGFLARRVDAPRALAALNPEQPYMLASTTKLVTSLAALDLLGENYRWRTFAYAKGELVDERLDGDLLIVGGGDARLSSDGLLAWFRQIQSQGLREIGGNIVLDRFAFRLTLTDHANTPLPEPSRPHHVWPDALTLDEGLLRVEVVPTAKGRNELRMTPPLAGVQIVDRLSAAGGCTAHAEMSAPGGPLKLIVSGASSPACGVQQLQFVPLSHAEFTTRAVAGLWQRAGGKLGGHVLDHTQFAGSAVRQHDADGELEMPFSTHRSDALALVMHDINKTSNNLGARNLMLSLAPGFPFESATLADARGRVQRWLLAQGIGSGDLEIDNGSGLSRTERGKPRAMVELLCKAWRGTSAKAFVDSLPIAGVDGTLQHRMQDGPAAGHAFLKTGTLQDVRALAGYVRARSGKVYAVAAMLNHPDAAAGTPVLDALIEWIAKNG